MKTTVTGGAIVPLDQYLSLPDVIKITSKSRAGIYRDMGLGIFPRARKIGRARVAWLASEINAWMRSRPSAIAA